MRTERAAAARARAHAERGDGSYGTVSVMSTGRPPATVLSDMTRASELAGLGQSPGTHQRIHIKSFHLSTCESKESRTAPAELMRGVFPQVENSSACCTELHYII